MSFPYATPRAFRVALKDRFAAVTKVDPRLSIDELQRQFAYDRVLARCFTAPDSSGWVLKGAGALLARLGGIARHSKDIDLYFAQQVASADRAVASFLDAIDRDLEDHFRFEVLKSTPLQEDARGRRVYLDAFLGSRYATFHVDIVVGTAMSGVPETVAPLTPIEVPGLIRPFYRVFPMADHLADKVCAIVEPHSGPDGATRASSRVKDLVDIAIIAGSHAIAGPSLQMALQLGAAHRGITLPDRFMVPNLEAWRTGYARRAQDMPGHTPTFDGAIDIACRLLDPVLAGRSPVIWDPAASEWVVDHSPT